MMNKKKRIEYQKKTNLLRDLYERLEDAKDDYSKFKAEPYDFDLVRYSLVQTKALLNLLLDAEEEEAGI